MNEGPQSDECRGNQRMKDEREKRECDAVQNRMSDEKVEMRVGGERVLKRAREAEEQEGETGEIVGETLC